MASKSIDWDEVLLTKDPKKKEIEVSFKKIDGDGNLISFGDEPGTPPGTGEKNCSNFISSTIHTDAYPWQDGQFFEFYVTLTQPLLYDLTIGLIYSFPGDEAAVVAPSSVVMPAGQKHVRVTGNLSADATTLIPFPIDISLDYSIDGNDPCLGAFGLVKFDDAATVDPIIEEPSDDGPGNGGPVPPDEHPECGDTSCASWDAFAAGGYDSAGENWAGKVVRFFIPETEYDSQDPTLIGPDEYGYGKVFSHFDGTPSQYYATEGYYGPDAVAANDITTVDFENTMFASTILRGRNAGGNAACADYRINAGTVTGSYIAHRQYDLAITGSGTGVITDAARSLDGYGLIVGNENYYGALSSVMTPWTSLTGGTVSGSGTGNLPGSRETFLKVKRNYTFWVGPNTVAQDFVEPPAVTYKTDGSGRVETSTNQINIPMPDYRVYLQTYDARRDDTSSLSSVTIGGSRFYIYSDALVLHLDSNDLTPEENAWSQKHLPFPNDGTAAGWYTFECTYELAVEGPFDVPSDSFYHTGYYYYDLSRVNIYKNGQALLYDYPLGDSALTYANLTGNPHYVPRTESVLTFKDKNSFRLIGYRQLAGTDVKLAFNPNGMIRQRPMAHNEHQTLMMMYDGIDAINLPRSEFGRRWSRQMASYITPAYCSRIPT